jgi:hypothetical protein
MSRTTIIRTATPIRILYFVFIIPKFVFYCIPGQLASNPWIFQQTLGDSAKAIYSFLIGNAIDLCFLASLTFPMLTEGVTWYFPFICSILLNERGLVGEPNKPAL